MALQPSSDQPTTNYMVPSNGQTHAVQFAGNFGATPQLIDWRQFGVDNYPFQPQGAFIDNSLAVVPLTINVMPINYTLTIPAGFVAQVQFPAPNGQWMYVTGDPNNKATITFVDFPVMPAEYPVGAAATGGSNVTIAGVAAGIVNDLPVKIDAITAGITFPVGTLSAGAAGGTLPYRTQEFAASADIKTGQMNVGSTSVTLTPTTAGGVLKGFRITLTGDARMAAAGYNSITAKVNGVTLFSKTIWLPVAAPALPTPSFDIVDFELNNVGYLMGAFGLVFTVATLLTGGVWEVTAIFAPQ